MHSRVATRRRDRLVDAERALSRLADVEENLNRLAQINSMRQDLLREINSENASLSVLSPKKKTTVYAKCESCGITQEVAPVFPGADVKWCQGCYVSNYYKK